MEGGPAFNTTVISRTDGHEQRVINRNRATRRFTISYVPSTEAEVDELNALFTQIAGRYATFLVRDWGDYYAGGTIVRGSGFTPGTLAACGTGNGSLKVFPLVKQYTYGSSTVTRTIYHPLATRKVYVNGTDVTVTLNPTVANGTITFASAPAVGAVIAWSGYFDIPCRLDSDHMAFSATIARLGEWLSVALVEML